MINNVTLVGRISSDLNLTERGENNTPFLQFQMAVDRGDQNDNTDFLPVRCWGKTAENLVEYREKGDIVAVPNGKLQRDSWKDNDGEYQERIYVHANYINYMFGVGGGSGDSGDVTNDPDEILDEVELEEDDEDLPF